MKQCEAFGVSGVVPGSAEDVAARQKKIEAKQSEGVVEEVSEEFPSLGRMYEMLKNGGEK